MYIAFFLFFFFFYEGKTLAYLYGRLTDLISFGAYTRTKVKIIKNQEDIIADVIH